MVTVGIDNSGLRVSYTNRSLQRRQCTCLLTFVLISFHLFTDAHQLRVQKLRCCGTTPVEHFAFYITTDDQLWTVLGDI